MWIKDEPTRQQYPIILVAFYASFTRVIQQLNLSAEEALFQGTMSHINRRFCRFSLSLSLSPTKRFYNRSIEKNYQDCHFADWLRTFQTIETCARLGWATNKSIKKLNHRFKLEVLTHRAEMIIDTYHWMHLTSNLTLMLWLVIRHWVFDINGWPDVEFSFARYDKNSMLGLINRYRYIENLR